MKPTAVAVAAKIASAVPAVAGKVWLDEAKDGETLPYAVYEVDAAGPDRAAFDASVDERLLFTIRVYATDPSITADYLDALSTAFAPKATKLTLTSGQHIATWAQGRTLPMRDIAADGTPCYLAELRLRIESTRA